MLWGLADRFVDEVIAYYGSREQAEQALDDVLRDEPGWKGMVEVVRVPRPQTRHWRPKGRPVRTRCGGL